MLESVREGVGTNTPPLLSLSQPASSPQPPHHTPTPTLSKGQDWLHPAGGAVCSLRHPLKLRFEGYNHTHTPAFTIHHPSPKTIAPYTETELLRVRDKQTKSCADVRAITGLRGREGRVPSGASSSPVRTPLSCAVSECHPHPPPFSCMFIGHLEVFLSRSICTHKHTPRLSPPQFCFTCRAHTVTHTSGRGLRGRAVERSAR